MKIKKVTAVLLAGAIGASLMAGGCGNKMDQDEAVLTLGDQEISLGYANFVARYNQATYDSLLSSYYEEDYWTNESYADEDGRNMQETVKDQIMDEIETNMLLEAHMSDYGVEISDEEKTAMETAAQQFMEDNSREAVKAMGAEEEYVTDMLYYETIRKKMTEAIEATADTNVSDEECARRTFSYITIDTKGHTDDSGNYVEYTEDEAVAVKENAPAVAEMAKTDFEGAAEAYSYTVSTYSYGKDEASEEDGGFAAEVIAAADGMTAGQVSDVIEAENGNYYIIRLDSEHDEEASEDARNSIIEDRKEAKFSEVTEGWKEEADFELNEDAWAQVEFTGQFSVVQDEEDSDSSSEAEE